MIVPSQVAQRDRSTRPYWIALAGVVRDTVAPFCEENHYGFAIRVKETDSIAEKIESGRYEKWDDLDDLVACAIVVPAFSHEERVLEFLRGVFEEQTCRLRGATRKAPDVFRFDSTRFIGKLVARPELGRPPAVEDTQFEVQVRSAFEHAWSTTTHALVYKSAVVDWRRLRLAGQLKAAVEQIDLLIQGFEGSAELVDASPWPELDEQAELHELLTRKISEGALPSHLAPKDWSRLVGNVHAILRAASRTRRGTSERVERAVASLDERLTVENADDLPVSCSLWQVVAGTLAEAEVLTSAPSNFTPLITDEMLTFFPAASRLGRGFEF